MFDREMRDRLQREMDSMRARRERDMWAREAREWARPVRTYTTTSNNYYASPTTGIDWNAVQTYYVHDEVYVPQVQQPPVPTEPSRYFPGSNTPAERAETQESQHERRVREYREAVARARRQRR